MWRMVKQLLVSLRIMGVFSTVLLWLTLSPALAQCTFDKTTQDMSNAGTLRLQATTVQDSCQGRTAEVVGWISGQTIQCASGSAQGSTCKKEETDGNTNAIVNVYKSTCGPGEGRSNHKMWAPLVEIATEFDTDLDAGDCEPPPDCTATGDCPDDGDDDSPILISLRKNAHYKLTSPEDGVMFDLNGDGILDKTAWTEANSGVAFLAFDRNGDGRINDGKELFGNNTYADITNGFIALRTAMMSLNGGLKKGAVREEADGGLMQKLLLWTDDNHNGISERDELQPALDVLSAIGLSYTPTATEDPHGNRFVYQGWAHLRTAPGKNKAKSPKEDQERSIVIWDVFFKVIR
jgi:hypothetical protein